MMKRTVLIILASLLAMLVLPSQSLAQPDVCAFYGTVGLNGDTVLDGTIVRAWMDGIEVGSAATLTYNGHSVYTLNINGTGHDYRQKTVRFTVGTDNTQVSGESIWERGAVKNVDLTVPPLTPEVGFSSIAGYLVIAWTFHGSTQTWQVYDPVSPPYVSTLTALVRGCGYWIKVTQDCTLTYGPDTYNLYAGWNLIGWLG